MNGNKIMSAQMKKSLTYSDAGVDSTGEDAVLGGMLRWLRKTFNIRKDSGAVQLDFGLFANVVDIGRGLGLAISTDGVGTKVLIAQMLGKYDTIGIDCVAMNVNDVLCVGAEPITMVDYIAVQGLDPLFLEEIGKGLYEGAARSNISIPGGEIAQLKEMIRGHSEKSGFDLVGTCVGVVPLDKLIIGQEVEEGDIIVGIESNGVHSNGLTLAREALFTNTDMRVDQYIEELGTSVGEELLKPTHIYVREVLNLINSGVKIKGLAHITSDGFLNLLRFTSNASYIIESLPDVPPIFSLIQKKGGIDYKEMLRVFNMGIGFCIVAPENEVPKIESAVREQGKKPYRIGYAVKETAGEEKSIIVKPYNLIGKGGLFRKI